MSVSELDVKFYGDHILTTVTSSASIVDEWIATVMHIYRRKLCKLLVGLDTEWCLPDESNGGHQKVAILQLCVGKRCLIFQLCHADSIPLSLTNFFGNKKFKFVGKGVKEDAKKLYEDYGIWVARTKDVGSWAARKYDDTYYRKRGLKGLVLEFLDKYIPKPREITLSKWDVKELTFEQVEYACLDAFVSLELGIYLSRPILQYIYVEEMQPKKIEYPTEFDSKCNEEQHELNLTKSKQLKRQRRSICDFYY